MNIPRFQTEAIIHFFGKQSPIYGYGIAVMTVVIAAIATHINPVIGERAAFLLFFFAIIQTAFWFGLNPGILAMILSLIAVNTLVLSPASIGTYNDLILNAGFCLLSVFMIATTSFHRKSTAALWESRQDLDYAQRVGQIGSWRLNVQRNELRWSGENHRIFGVPMGTPLTYETFLSTVHPEDREYVDRMWQAGLRGEPYDIEHRLIVAGKVKWVRERAVLEFGKKGNLLGGFGTTQDITDHKRSELLLAESRQRYAGIVESAMDAIITIDTDQRIMVFNAAAEKMFGCKAYEAIGASIERFIPERFHSAHEEHIRDFKLSEATIRKKGELGTVKGLRANGEEFPIEASISRCEIDEEKSFTAILRDVTERMRVEGALKEQLRLHDQLTKVAASTPGLICSFRLRPDGSASMPYASSAIESIYGFSHEVLAEDFSPVFTRIHPDDIGHIHETISESARTMLPWRDEFRYTHPVKGEVWLEGHSMPLRETDGSILWHGFIRDVTAQKQVEAELQERIARYELVLDGAQDAIWDWDVVNKRVLYSSRWKALRGFAEDEVGNDEEAWSANIYPDDLARVLAAVQSHFEGKTPVFCEEYRTRCKDGSWKWILDRGICQRDPSGQVIRMAGSENDITDRKLAETALKDRESELRLIMDATPALISYLNTDFRYMRVNKTYENWFCISRDRILGQHARKIIGESAWRIVRPYLERARAGERVSFDQVIPYGTGKPRWVHVSYIPEKDVTGSVKGIVVHIFDIDKQKRTEEALRESQKENKFLADLIRVSSQPIGIGYPDGRVELINKAFEELTGYSLEELQHIDWRSAELTPPEWREIELDKLAELQLTGIPVRYEKEYLRKNGTRVPVELLVHLVTDSEGKPELYYSFVNDITERKRAAEALRASEAFVRGVLNALPEHVVVLDEHGVVSAVNEPWERFAIENGGAPCDVSVGTNYLDVCRRSSAAGDPEAQKAVEGLEALFVGERQKFTMEYPCPTPSSERWFLMQATRVTQGLQGIIVTHIDITELKHTSLALQETEARLALLFEEVKAGYWDWDLNTNKVYLSPEWKRQLGFDENDSLNQWEDWESRLHPEDRAFVLEATENYISGRQSVYELEFRLCHKDGSYRWIHSRGGLLRDQTNHPYRMMGIDLDVTEYKKTKELSEKREQMEQAFRLHIVGQTLAAIAHELNQPLSAISSYADVALHMLLSGNRNQEKLAHVLENCVLQAQRAGDVIRQLMTVLHKGETVSEPVYLNNLIHLALDIVKANRDFGAFNIELELTAGLPKVSANSLQIQKVLVNLMHNGLESMQESGISVGNMTIRSRSSADDPAMAQVTVCDSGKGVADTATLKTMFQPFHTTKPSGLGMGLAISRALIEAHGGKMWAEKNAGNGISVHLTLPFDK
jgi:PAS domain S-box-containing protein